MTATIDWQPTATIATLRLRAAILAQIRLFFSQRGVLEVETPLLAQATVTDLHLHSFHCRDEVTQQNYYLQTSPEYAMKRLLAAGSGAIFQISKAFRQEEVGKKHNPEFTLLEWYQPGFDYQRFMNELDLFLQTILNSRPAQRISYRELFTTHFNINPHRATWQTLLNILEKKSISLTTIPTERDDVLNLLMSHCIEPQLGFDCPIFIYDYPASQAALAKITEHDGDRVAERFEAYVCGVELANGFHELQDPEEQRRRFEQQCQQRQQMGLPLLTLDERFLAALNAGLPACTGVALGIDRLIMLALRLSDIKEVLAFDWTRA